MLPCVWPILIMEYSNYIPIFIQIVILGTHVEDNLYVFRHRVDLAVAYSHATLCMANINYGFNHIFANLTTMKFIQIKTLNLFKF